ncbi:NAD-dependent epimerase/dehydratase family protein [Glaciimonas sp. PCH181]|uniref:NAD-dependent epimerase/dehydratase family protein n=1 Tax=Glaciimonas sp. PCH181 TaxID=2133943 RepID=UPI000D36E629|nr:NAD-dependent epimerase/dehydratase family protein [Glaciimonas sp. PCH181]PUA17184.1 epimerase [Glaciimonas sp. PCH181]
MRVLIVGASGMVGQGVLRECLAAPDVEEVILLARSTIESASQKVRQLVRDDLFDLTSLEPELRGIDACFFCLGVSSSGMSEAAYRHVTFDLTLTVANVLVQLNPAMTFIYVSGAGTDSSELGRSMWARVKGQTENALKKLPFAGVYLFRPAIIQPLHGIQSKTSSYRRFYKLTRPLLPVMKSLFPSFVVTTEEVGQAMLNAMRRGSGRFVLESRDIARLALSPSID